MKLAKKVLAVVMALGLIAVMSAMAFAADAGSYSFDVTKSEDGDTLYATLYAHDYIGLASGTVTVTYSGVKFDHASTGTQAKAVNDSLDNSFTADVNNTQAGKVIYGFYFKENLWDASTFYENGDGAPLVIDTDNFDIVTFTFKGAKDAASYEISVNVSSKSVDGDNAPFADTCTGTNEVAPNPVKVVDTIPGTEDKKDDEKKCDDKKADDKACDTKTASTKTVKTDGGKNTGDNGVIAVVAGVIALAGAAFVVTKKRK